MAVKPLFSAGDIILKNQKEIEVNTKDLKGKRILLSFHPLAFTSVCAKQMQSLEQNYAKFEALDVVPLGVSIDHAPVKKAWADSLGIEKLDLLCDFWPHGALAKRLDIFIEKFGFSERVNVILDENRTVQWIKVYPIKELPDVNEVLEVLKNTVKK